MSDDSGFLDDFLMDQDKRQIIYDSVDELKKLKLRSIKYRVAP